MSGILVVGAELLVTTILQRNKPLIKLLKRYNLNYISLWLHLWSILLFSRLNQDWLREDRRELRQERFGWGSLKNSRKRWKRMPTANLRPTVVNTFFKSNNLDMFLRESCLFFSRPCQSQSFHCQNTKHRQCSSSIYYRKDIAEQCRKFPVESQRFWRFNRRLFRPVNDSTRTKSESETLLVFHHLVIDDDFFFFMCCSKNWKN